MDRNYACPQITALSRRSIESWSGVQISVEITMFSLSAVTDEYKFSFFVSPKIILKDDLIIIVEKRWIQSPVNFP